MPDLEIPAEQPPPPPTAKPSLLIPALGLLLLSAVGLLIWRNALGSSGRPATDAAYQVYDPDASPLRGFALEPPRPAPDFTLIDPEGQPFRLAQSQGEARLLFFGYTECPDVCPQTLTRLAAGLRALGPRAERARVIFISVDPERDTPERIGRYVAGFHPRITGLTGELATLEAVAADYGVAFEKDPPAGAAAGVGDYQMLHSATVFLIDPAGRIRATYLEPLPEDLAQDLGWLLDEDG
ncbi:MAG: SCO family protein [Chloroflexi bacterium]|nr:SCO family protein [Chloroflexota bacterium]